MARPEQLPSSNNRARRSTPFENGAARMMADLTLLVGGGAFFDRLVVGDYKSAGLLGAAEFVGVVADVIATVGFTRRTKRIIQEQQATIEGQASELAPLRRNSNSQ